MGTAISRCDGGGRPPRAPVCEAARGGQDVNLGPEDSRWSCHTRRTESCARDRTPGAQRSGYRGGARSPAGPRPCDDPGERVTTTISIRTATASTATHTAPPESAVVPWCPPRVGMSACRAETTLCATTLAGVATVEPGRGELETSECMPTRPRTMATASSQRTWCPRALTRLANTDLTIPRRRWHRRVCLPLRHGPPRAAARCMPVGPISVSEVCPPSTQALDRCCHGGGQTPHVWPLQVIERDGATVEGFVVAGRGRRARRRQRDGAGRLRRDRRAELLPLPSSMREAA